MTTGWKARYGPGARAAAPLAVAVAAFAVTFGALAREAGMSDAAALVMSVTTFAGGAQFAAVSVLGGGGSVLTAATVAALLNLRYVPIGISVAPALRGRWWRRVATAQLAVDEAWAVSHVGGGRYDADRLVGAGVVVLVAWVGGTAAGLAAGAVLHDPAALGLDALTPALFLALLMGQMRDRMAVAAVVGAAAIALALVPVAPLGIPVVASAVVGLLGLWGPR